MDDSEPDVERSEVQQWVHWRSATRVSVGESGAKMRLRPAINQSEASKANTKLSDAIFPKTPRSRMNHGYQINAPIPLIVRSKSGSVLQLVVQICVGEVVSATNLLLGSHLTFEWKISARINEITMKNAYHIARVGGICCGDRCIAYWVKL